MRGNTRIWLVWIATVLGVAYGTSLLLGDSWLESLIPLVVLIVFFSALWVARARRGA